VAILGKSGDCHQQATAAVSSQLHFGVSAPEKQLFTFHTRPFVNVYSTFVCNGPKDRTSRCPPMVDGYTLVHAQSATQSQKEGTVTCTTVRGSREQCRGKMPRTPIPNDFLQQDRTALSFLKWQSYKTGLTVLSGLRGRAMNRHRKGKG
jgi:hypothetical protein